MENMTQRIIPRRAAIPRILVIVAILFVGALLIGGLLLPVGTPRLRSIEYDQNPLGAVLTLALPTFLAGIFSFLSPCILPILPAYFAFTFEARRHQIVLMTLSFFLGMATTMTLLGATFSLLGSFIGSTRDSLTLWGGIAIIGFGIASLLGKGIGGIKVQHRPSTTFVGTYLYGMTFALGWSPCSGPILGALLTLLVAQGASVLAGALLAAIYALGLAVPLGLVAVCFHRLRSSNWAWGLLRGRSFAVTIGKQQFYLHTTSMLSGLLLIAIGYLLISGQIFVFSQWAQATQASEWAINLETWISRSFAGSR